MSDNQAIKEKILKLLNVKREHGSSEAEVNFAMAAASKLMLAHGISQSELHQSQAVAGRSETTEVDTDWQKVLAHCAGNLFGCMTLFSRSSSSGAPVFYYIGRPENHDAAKQTFNYLCDQVERLYKISLPRGMTQRDRANYRRTFKYACANRVYHRADGLIAEMKRGEMTLEGHAAGSTALVVQGYFDKLSDEVDEFLKKTNMTIRTIQPKVRHAGLGTAAGRSAAESVNLRSTLK